MKTRAMLMAAVVALTVFASARVASAQDTVTVKIPFAFAAGGATLPAGDYTVQASDLTHSLTLRSDSGAVAIVAANAAQSANIQSQTKLVFNRYGSRYFLSQVWVEGRSIGKQLMKSQREKETALSARNEAPAQVTLVASGR